MATKTLASIIKSASIDFEILHKNYKPMLGLVKELIGVVPNCDPILEIWSTGFRTYNLLVPNMLNLPHSLLGGKRMKSSMGLAMYTSSMTASCPYCAAHCCSYALRRGLNQKAIYNPQNPQEQAIVAIANGLSTVPVSLTVEDCKKMQHHFSGEEVETIVYSIGLMGFLNKYMDAMGIELEQESINDVGQILSKTKWNPGKHINGALNITKITSPKVDNIRTYLRVLKYAPNAILLEKKWTIGVPNNATKASEYLKEHTGYSFPILKHIAKKRIVVSLTTVLRDNLNHESTVVGLPIKTIAGYVYATVILNHLLASEIREIIKHFAPDLSDSFFEKLDAIIAIKAPSSIDEYNELIGLIESDLSLTHKEAAIIILAITASPSPAIISDVAVDQTATIIKPESIVEVMVWLSVLQLLHRLSSYYALRES
jgi:hypothetical protein